MPSIEFPPAEADRLRALRASGELPALRARIKALRDVKWTLRAIGGAMGAPHTTVRMWQEAADSNLPVIPSVPLPPKFQRENVIRLRPDIPADEIKDLQRLAVSARKIRGWTPADSQERKDAVELERRLEIYVERRVPVKRIADHLNVSFRAVAARLERAAERHANEVKKSA